MHAPPSRFTADVRSLLTLAFTLVLGTSQGCAGSREVRRTTGAIAADTAPRQEAGTSGQRPVAVRSDSTRTGDSLVALSGRADTVTSLAARPNPGDVADTIHDYRIRRASSGRVASAAKTAGRVLNRAMDVYLLVVGIGLLIGLFLVFRAL